jgi:peptidoglycan/LPS O-acetylase OafA/YrhL
MGSRPASRSTQLDVLRAVAALLVVCMHVKFVPILSAIGWIGVDLFFVLSGFLISRLLFKEAAETGDVQIRRFYLRRAFKIYPPFWVLLAATPFILSEPPTNRQWAVELSFMQSYFEGIWGLTWSLAVEEHFYLLLPLLLVLLFRTGRHRIVPAIGAVLLIVCTLLRYLGVRHLGAGPWDPSPVLRSHVRMDQLFVGVVIGYWFTRDREAAALELKRWHWLPLAAMAAGLLMVLIAPKQVVLSIGLAVLSVGFGGLVLTAACQQPRAAGWIERALAEIGRSSYALYLWHIPMFVIFSRATGLAPNLTALTFASYLTLTIVWSIALTRLFEDPILAFRDRQFPGGKRNETPVVIRASAAV